MNEFEARCHRTWLALLVEGNYREVAALVVESELKLLQDGWGGTEGLTIGLTPSAYPFTDDVNIRQVIEKTLRAVVTGHLFDQNGNAVRADDLRIEFRIRLLDVEDGWKEKIKEMIANSRDSNQGNISEKIFTREKRQIYVYNEMKFASQSEIRIAQELERRKVLFFPLPLAIRNDTGRHFSDHREVDFLVCQEGVWGILEVSYHPDRYEQDAEKDAWFKQSGILCVEHRSAEKCYNESGVVVDGFLAILAKHKRQ